MTIERIGILLTLLLTILGWVVTAYYQRRILDYQLKSEKEREARLLIIPARIQRLNETRAWVDSSTEIIILRLNNLLSKSGGGKTGASPSDDLPERFRDWFAASAKYSTFIAEMELLYEPKNNQLAKSVGQLHESMIDLMSHEYSPDESDAKIQSWMKVITGLLLGIEELIELCANNELNYKKGK